LGNRKVVSYYLKKINYSKSDKIVEGRKKERTKLKNQDNKWTALQKVKNEASFYGFKILI